MSSFVAEDATPKTPSGQCSSKEHDTDKKYECPNCGGVGHMDREGRRYFCHGCKKTVKVVRSSGKRTKPVV